MTLRDFTEPILYLRVRTYYTHAVHTYKCDVCVLRVGGGGGCLHRAENKTQSGGGDGARGKT